MAGSNRGRCWSIASAVVIITIIVILILACVDHSEPSVYIQELYVPAFNNPTELNTNIFIDFEFHRDVAFTRRSYPDFKISLFYGFNRRFLPVANQTVAGFSMGCKRRVHKKVAVEASGLPWEDAFQKVSGGSRVALLVELVEKHRFKYCSIGHKCWWSEAEVVQAAAVVWVDASGEKVSMNPITLH